MPLLMKDFVPKNCVQVRSIEFLVGSERRAFSSATYIIHGSHSGTENAKGAKNMGKGRIFCSLFPLGVGDVVS